MKKRIQQLTLQVYSRLDLSSKKALELRDMKISIEEHCRRAREMKFHSEAAERLLRFLAEYDDGFYCPERCDVYEPIKEIFDLTDLSDPIRWISQPGCLVLVKRMQPFRYEAYIENHRFTLHWIDNNPTPEPMPPDPVFLTEWCLWLRVKLLKLKSLEEVRRFFIDLFLVSEGDYGFLTMEEDHRNKNYLITDEGERGISYRFVGDNLEKCLPGVYWGNIFGKDYVDWFGEEKFSALPCFYKEKLVDGSYYVQSSDNLDYFRTPDAIDFTGKIAQHLGSDAFFDIRQPERVCRVPEFAKRRADE